MSWICHLFFLSNTSLRKNIPISLQDDTSDTDCDQDIDWSDEDAWNRLYDKYSSPLIVRLIVYCVYAQFLVHHIHRCMDATDDTTYYLTHFVQWIISTCCRIAQICGIFLVYGGKMYQRSDCEQFWFTYHI